MCLWRDVGGAEVEDELAVGVDLAGSVPEAVATGNFAGAKDG
jgi:hypothetical protein